MGVKEEETGNVVPSAPIMGEPWWLISYANGVEFCCHVAASWFEARDVGRRLTNEQSVSAKLVEKKKEKKMGYDAKILADSISPAGHRLTTFEVTFPRIVLAEFNTHRMLSRNSASSRAIPVEKRISQVEADPFVPATFGKNQKGMQASETLDKEEGAIAANRWRLACRGAIEQASELAKLGVHKQLANRLLEPFSWHTVICTATDWENFFNLRCHPNAQPEIRTVAEMMRELYTKAVPQPVNLREWHLPLIQRDERIEFDRSDRTDEWMAKISAARCARISYLTHDGKRDPRADLDLYEKLTTNGHMSPLEHPARPMTDEELRATKRYEPVLRLDDVLPFPTYYLGNFNGWVQLRKLIPGESVFTEGAT